MRCLPAARRGAGAGASAGARDRRLHTVTTSRPYGAVMVDMRAGLHADHGPGYESDHAVLDAEYDELFLAHIAIVPAPRRHARHFLAVVANS